MIKLKDCMQRSYKDVSVKRKSLVTNLQHHSECANSEPNCHILFFFREKCQNNIWRPSMGLVMPSKIYSESDIVKFEQPQIDIKLKNEK